MKAEQIDGALVHAERRVPVAPADVWKHLAEREWAWSGTIRRLEIANSGDRATLVLRAPIGEPSLDVQLLVRDRDRELRWIGGVPGLFSGEHYFRISEDGDATLIEHGELFRGPLARLISGSSLEAMRRVYADDLDRLISASTGLSTPALPADLQALTAEWLQAAVVPFAPQARVRTVRQVDAARAGDGVASTADRVVFDVEYDVDAGLPRRMLLKTTLLPGTVRVGPGMFRALGRTLEGIERLPSGVALRDVAGRALMRFGERFPQAPDAMYENEVRFYRDLRAQLDLETPRVFASVRDPKSRRFGILMEDLRLRGARFPSVLDSMSADSIRALLSTLARLHARFWHSPRFASDLAWVPTSTSGGMHEVFAGIGRDLARAQLALYPFKQRIFAPLGRDLDSMWAAMWDTQRKLLAEPQTLLHGDTHLGNTYHLPDGSAGLLDWQLMMRGHFIHDVTYAIVTGVPIEVRRREERGFLAHYLDELRRFGVADVPTLEHTLELHRRVVSWGLLIGWCITPPQNYGEAITTENLERLVAAAVDLGTFEHGA